MTFIKPQLASSLDDLGQLPSYCKDDAWHFDQKVDGWRKLVYVVDGDVIALNKKGERADLPRFVTAALSRVKPGTWTFDGELLDGVFYVFDMPVAADIITPADEYQHRQRTMAAFLGHLELGPAVRVLPVATTHLEKAAMAERLLKAGAEGVMVKRADAPYCPGPRATKHVIKAKFVKTVDCVVMSFGAKGHNNAVLGLYDGERLVEVGRVTCENGDGPKLKRNSVIEVRYLTATADRRLREPTLPKLRDDKSPEECTIDQLIYSSKEVLS
jgi:ATP-dependent DNA ligase